MIWRSARRRLRGVNPATRPTRTSVQFNRPLWGSVAIAAAVGLLIGGYGGLICGLGAGIGGYTALRRAVPAEVRRAHAQAVADLPFALDVIAACLRAGTPVAQAIAAAGEAVGATMGDRFSRTAKALSLGTPVPQAFAELAGFAETDRLIAALTRSGHTGATLAEGLALLAAELRQERELAVQAVAHRAGVWMVLPLCLCFLPAFVAAGLIPVVVSALRQVLNTY